VFTEHNSAKGDALLAALKTAYPQIKSLADVTPAVGIANAYDALHLATLAIEKAGSTDGKAVRDGFYAINEYDGLIKHYKQPFTASKHDALGPDDYLFTHFVNDQIVPLKPKE
jgi:branched-chain amino acid transport system substrate-binding protein